MGIDLRCLEIRMPQQLLDGPDITTRLQQVGCIGVPQAMAPGPFADLGHLDRPGHGLADG